MNSNTQDRPRRIVVVGLGYVGLPLAVALARTHAETELIGFDIDARRIDELSRGLDRTLEVEPEAVAASTSDLPSDDDCGGADIFVTVPTPRRRRPPARPGPRLAAGGRGRDGRPRAAATDRLRKHVYRAIRSECGPRRGRAGWCAGAHSGGYSPSGSTNGDKVHRATRSSKSSRRGREVRDQAVVVRRDDEAGVFAPPRSTPPRQPRDRKRPRDIIIAFMTRSPICRDRVSYGTYSTRRGQRISAIRARTGRRFTVLGRPYYLSHHAQEWLSPRVICRDATHDGMGGLDRRPAARAHGPPAAGLFWPHCKEKYRCRNTARSTYERLQLLGHELAVTDRSAKSRRGYANMA